MRVFAISYDNSIPARAYVLADAESIEFSTGATGGFIDATIKLNRRPGRLYADTAFGNHLEIRAQDGEIVWEGYIHATPQNIGETNTYNVVGAGYLSLLVSRTSSWQPTYTAATEIATVIKDGLALVPGVNYSATTIPNTGRTVVYSPDAPSSVRNHIDEVLKYGTSSDVALYWQMWANRVFYLRFRDDTANPTYTTALSLCQDAEIGLNADNFFTRVTVKYKGDAEVMYATEDATYWQQRYGRVFGSNNPSATRLDYIREADPIDITSHGKITDAQARQVARTMLSKYTGTGIRMVSSRMVFNKEGAIRYSTNGMPMPLCKVKAGFTTQVRDQNTVDTNNMLQASMFIGTTRFSQDNSGNISMELTAEASISTDNILSTLLASPAMAAIPEA